MAVKAIKFKGLNLFTRRAYQLGRVGSYTGVRVDYNISDKKFVAGVYCLQPIERLVKSFKTEQEAKDYANALKDELVSIGAKLI